MTNYILNKFIRINILNTAAGDDYGYRFNEAHLHLIGKQSLFENVGVEREELLTLVDVLCVHQYSIMFVLPFLW